jgi:hypothetical protein
MKAAAGEILPPQDLASAGIRRGHRQPPVAQQPAYSKKK